MIFPPNGKPTSIKEKIIQILSYQYPLTAKKIYNEIKKDNSVSYQAVYKTLKEFEENGVIEKENKEYHLDENWVSSMHETFEKIKSNALKNLKFSSDEQIFFFNSRDHIVKHLSFILSNAEKGDIVFGHNKSNLDYPQTFYNALTKAIERGVKIRFIITKNSDMKRFGQFLLNFKNKNVSIRATDKDYFIRIFGILGKEVIIALPFNQSMNGIYVKDGNITNYLYISFMNYWNISKTWSYD